MGQNQIILATINAKYYHTSLALKYLKANLFEYEEEAQILEFASSMPTHQMAQRVMDFSSKIVALGVYIWNKTKIIELIPLIKANNPDSIIILGGPEVSYDLDPIFLTLADYIIQGEAEVSFYQLVKNLETQSTLEPQIIRAIRPDLSKLKLPYYLYAESELQNRFVMVESSRGCPYGCEFCLSALDKEVRYFPIDEIIKELSKLLSHKASQFKFIDRTFNLKKSHVERVLDLFLQNMHPNLFLHLEVTPTNIGPELLAKLALFSAGTLQLEIGVQTLTPHVLERITRKASPKLVIENLLKIKETNALIHADLILGLPGETLPEIESSFNQLFFIRPNEIQVGILKKLKGALIKRHDQEFAMTYSELPPYEIISNSTIHKTEMDQLKHFAKFFELIVNRKQFVLTLNHIFVSNNPFGDFWNLSNSLYNSFGRDYSLTLDQLYIAIFEYLESDQNRSVLISDMRKDYLLKPRKYLPAFLKQES